MENAELSTAETHSIWESDAEAKMLESRLNGFWNPDYFTRILLPQLDLKPGARVLDVGSGNGSLTLLLARSLPDVHFVGVDITPKIVAEGQELARKMGITNVEFREADALQLPFGTDSFDAVVCQTLLIHLNNPAAAVKEMSRVLKPGGRFMAAEFYILSLEPPIDAQKLVQDEEEGLRLARYTQLFINGYRKSGQGNLKGGGQVPFLAVDAGLQVRDVRINDRLPHAFPPYRKPNEQAAFAEANTWAGLFVDPSYRAWVTGSMLAAGGTESDVDGFLELVLAPHQREGISRGVDGDYAFLWVINPVLLITVAVKP